jgi:cytochrome P450
MHFSLSICAGRSNAYVSLSQNFSQDVPLAAFVLRQLPKALRPILAPIVTLPNKYHIRKARQQLDPEIKARLSKLDPGKGEPCPQHNDFLQWMINDAQTRLSDKPKEITPHMLVGRLLAMNFAAIHTSTFSITNAIFDLVSSDPALNYLEQLREEAASVLAEDAGIWTKQGMFRMHKIDSALRESLRLRSFLSVGMVRKVVARNGITTPEGLHIPFGANIAVSAYGTHNDENNYIDPAVYDALRFVKQRDLIDAAEERADNDYIKKANFAMVSTSPEYQPFGHGRHACPGRFFAANELKLLLAYMVLNYDIEAVVERPRGSWIGTTMLPPMKATMKVRRRKGEDT